MEPWSVCLRWERGVRPRGNLREMVKPDGRQSMEINCLNLTSVNGAILNLKRKEKENWIDLTAVCYNTVMM